MLWIDRKNGELCLVPVFQILQWQLKQVFQHKCDKASNKHLPHQNYTIYSNIVHPNPIYTLRDFLYIRMILAYFGSLSISVVNYAKYLQVEGFNPMSSSMKSLQIWFSEPFPVSPNIDYLHNSNCHIHHQCRFDSSIPTLLFLRYTVVYIYFDRHISSFRRFQKYSLDYLIVQSKKSRQALIWNSTWRKFI